MASTSETTKGAANVEHAPKMTKRDDLLEIEATRAITAAEHALGFWAAVRQYPRATFWALFFCLAVVMAGYDAQIITSFYALPAFQQKYGRLVDGDGDYELSAQWQLALGMGNPIGQVLGALASGYPLEWFGRRWTLAACCLWSTGFVFVQFFATSIGMLCAGEILGGLAYGFYVVIAPTYASEICPLALRGVLTASTNLAFVIGQFVAQGVAAGLESRLDEWAYKAPFALQWLWPVIILAGLPFAPESPYWLIRQGRKSDARQALVKLSSSTNPPDIDQVLLGIEQTDLLEQELEAMSSYLDCLKGVSLVRTEISVMVYLIQVIGGNPLIGYANYFFEQAGLDSSDAFHMGVGNTALGFVGTVISWPLMNYFGFGRRTIYSAGLALMTLLLFVIGFLSIPAGNRGAIWAMATLMDVWTFVYQMTVGPICFVIISEISATRLRTKTIAIATAVQAAATIVTTVAMPYMLNADEANWGGKAGFLFGGISFMCFVWCYFRLPESRGRTFEELDILFERKVPARQFKDYDLLVEEVAGRKGAGEEA
ncbi:general substrate transporter [Achaetomium macrosporum]|uniref:General substrate transporter n=1 Tax=Achaetomium macrosporum TaxID=79813 RepID=A0AAN7HBS8_9PEZI|nr:general substrate transporter [Achaetomium macrosporum]